MSGGAAFAELKERLARVTDLGKAAAILGWDQWTMMPRRGAAARAEQLATLEQVVHELFCSDEVGRLLDELRPYEESLPPDSDDASLIRVARQDWEKARRVPVELRADLARTAALAREVWMVARAEADYERFRPHLERNVELKRRYIECFEPADDPYDVLLDDYERGMRTAEVRAVFERLKAGLVPLVEAVSQREGAVDAAFLAGPFPIDRQREVVDLLLGRLGFDPASWRLDDALHPFATSASTGDLRITTRFDEASLSSLFAAMHEGGHALYEAGIDPALERTPLATGCSLGLHESQSRLWENLVGRSLPFWRSFYPTLRDVFPEALGQVGVEAFYRAVNRVVPSLVRVEADEVTYNLHVILRFELEQQIIAGTVDLRELPDIWNDRMAAYLGVAVPDDAHGVLQDIHWAENLFGYFPTYALGNVMSVQIWEAARRELTDLDEQIEAGELGGLREWLRDHLHRFGRKLSPADTLARAAGGPLDPGPYLLYLQGKVGAVYGLP